ncbi:MAG TPA: glycoside hydrolase [Methylomirabilota bacterium]|nr:glycoside hydrolase [Methylomirabilota bacterium]
MIRSSRVCLLGFVTFVTALGSNRAAAQQFPESTYQEMRWRMIGPTRGGRTRAACGVPSQPNVFYMGGVNSGVWKSDDYGRTWNPIFDGQPTQSVGAIAVAPSDPNIVYVASGEGLARPDLSVGDGVYKSTDAGKTWAHLGLRDTQGIPAIAVDPRDPNRLFAAALGHPFGASEERGIYLSTDGGQNWQKVLSKDANVGGSDVEIDPSNPDVVYAALWEVRLGPWEDGNQYSGTGGGLFKSTDGGKTWRPLTNGLPKGIIQVNASIAASLPSRLYASVATNEPSVGIYRSDDAGESWTKVTTDFRPLLRIGGGDLIIPRVDPKNPDIVYSTSIVLMRSTDGGKTWTSFRGAPGGDDYQNLWINPNSPNIMLLTSDQGAVVTVNSGQTWSSWYNQASGQMYHVATSNSFPYLVCSGQQDSGSVCVSSRGNDGEITFRDWHPVGIIEYGYAAPDPLNPDIVYGAGRREVSRWSISTGQFQNVTPIPSADPKFRADRTQPIIFSPVDPHILYYAANFLFKTTNGGQTWQTISPDLAREHNGIPASLGDKAAKDPNAEKIRGVIYALAPSFKNVNTIWAGTDDGFLWITRDGGANWKNITPPELTPWSKVTQLAASHFDDDSAYASVSRFRIDDLHPYIYRTHDGGKSWRLITNGLPDAPVDSVREDPVRKGLLFAGTETSVWVSFDDGDHWQSLQLNLPHTSMRDLWIHENDLIVGTHGRSFWVLDDISPLRQLSDSVAKSDVHLFKPAIAYRVRRDTNTDTPLPPDEPTALNPPDGAVIDYFLAQPASTPVTLEILDPQGKLVRKFTDADKPDPSPEELAKELIPRYWIRMPKTLPTSAGMHRWVWDLHYASPHATRTDYPIAAVPGDTPRAPQGPMAAPGQYSVRLTVNGHTFTEPLTVKMDPRVKTSQEGLALEFQKQKLLAGLMTQSTEAITRARGLREQLQKLTGKTPGASADNPAASKISGPLADAVTAFEKKLSVLIGATGFGAAAAPTPTLGRSSGAIAGLYAEIDRSDAAPTAAQTAAIDAAQKDFSAVLKLWKDFQSTDVPALNAQLKAAGLPELQLSATPQAAGDEDDGDIE